MTSTTTTGRTYEVVVHRETHPEGSRRMLDIPDLGAVGRATGLADVGSEARGIIAAWDEDGPAEDDVHVTVRLDGPPVQGRR